MAQWLHESGKRASLFIRSCSPICVAVTFVYHVPVAREGEEEPQALVGRVCCSHSSFLLLLLLSEAEACRIPVLMDV